MDWFTDIRVKIRRFFKKYKRVIILALIIWAVIFAANLALKSWKQPVLPETTYTPNVSVMNDNEVPEKLQGPIANKIKEYMDYCNNKEYEKAYNLLSDGCKKYVYTSIDQFKAHIDVVFRNEKMLYDLQDYSNINGYYVYSVKIYKDILATGLTNEDFNHYDEKMVLKNTKNGIQLSIGGFVDIEDISQVAEDDNMKIRIKRKIITYEAEEYEVEIKNKTDKTIVLSDGNENDEIVLGIVNLERKEQNSKEGKFILLPEETTSFKFKFNKYFDDGRVPEYIKLNAIRILKEYSGDENNFENELKNAEKLYSLQIDL